MQIKVLLHDGMSEIYVSVGEMKDCNSFVYVCLIAKKNKQLDFELTHLNLNS